jgi:hypothetical protein
MQQIANLASAEPQLGWGFSLPWVVMAMQIGATVLPRVLPRLRSNYCFAVSESRYKCVMPTRRFPVPWTFEDHNDACFIVKDANGMRRLLLRHLYVW